MALKIDAPVDGAHEIDVLSLASGNAYTVELWACDTDSSDLGDYGNAAYKKTLNK